MRPLPSATIHMAAAYRWPAQIVVHPQSQTTAGFWIDDRPIMSLPLTGTGHDLGLAALQALSCSRSKVPVPNYKGADWTALQREVWGAAGQRSFRRFMANAYYVGLRLSDGVLTLQPTRNGGATGPDRGFRPLLEATLKMTAPADPKTLGDALSTAWSRCQPAEANIWEQETAAQSD